MRKTQIAAAFALGAVSLSAVAQTAVNNVTLYGRVNTTVERQKVDPSTGASQTTQGLFNNSSRWGVRGTEDMGGGLKALFQLESGFASDTGQFSNNGGIFNREAFAGLSGAFGTVRAGRITSPLYFASADYISMHNHDTGSSSDALFGFQATGGNNNNSVTYKTPSFSGADVEIAYSFAPNGQEVAGSGNNEVNTQIAINWVGGPLHLGGGWAQNKNKAPNPDVKNETAVIRGLYELGAFTIGGYYERSKFDVGGGQTRNRNNYRLAGMYTMGASEFHLNYGSAGDLSGAGNNDTGATQWTLGYNHNLSKRTKVYGYYTVIDNDTNADYSVTGSGSKFSSLAAGVRHNF